MKTKKKFAESDFVMSHELRRIEREARSAVVARLTGDIARAMRYESNVDKALRHAKLTGPRALRQAERAEEKGQARGRELSRRLNRTSGKPYVRSSAHRRRHRTSSSRRPRRRAR